MCDHFAGTFRTQRHDQIKSALQRLFLLPQPVVAGFGISVPVFVLYDAAEVVFETGNQSENPVSLGRQGLQVDFDQGSKRVLASDQRLAVVNCIAVRTVVISQCEVLCDTLKVVITHRLTL